MKKIKTFLCIVSEKIYWCSYFMKYMCKDCLADDYSVIPSFILQKWDFKKYTISKQAKEIITKWYDKPVIYIQPRDKIVKSAYSFKFANLLRKKINIIYDLMKCDLAEQFVLETLGEYRYLVLKEYIYSLKDLVDIHEGRLIGLLKSFFQKFEEHISGCSVRIWLMF
jgi:hypothetical protein